MCVGALTLFQFHSGYNSNGVALPPSGAVGLDGATGSVWDQTNFNGYCNPGPPCTNGSPGYLNARNLPRRVRNLNAIDIGLRYAQWSDGSGGSRANSALPQPTMPSTAFLPNQIIDMTGLFTGPIPVGTRLGYFFFVQAGSLIFPHAWLYYECTQCAVPPLP